MPEYLESQRTIIFCGFKFLCIWSGHSSYSSFSTAAWSECSQKLMPHTHSVNLCGAWEQQLPSPPRLYCYILYKVYIFIIYYIEAQNHNSMKIYNVFWIGFTHIFPPTSFSPFSSLLVLVASLDNLLSFLYIYLWFINQYKIDYA